MRGKFCSHRQLKSRSRRRDRGVALMMVMIAVIVAAVVAYSYVGRQSTSVAIARNVNAHARARYVAESGLELAIACVRSGSSWRSEKSVGVWLTDEPFGDGTFTVWAEDGEDIDGDGVISTPAEGDGNLADDSSDPLTLTVTGRTAGASHVVRAVLTPAGGTLNFGNETESELGQTSVKQTQIASQVNLLQDVTLTAIAAYIKGPPPKELRYAVYDDDNGEPGTLIVESQVEVVQGNTYYWHSADFAPTPLAAGTYWLALAFEHSNEYYTYMSGGQTRYKNNDAVGNGFDSSWGSSSASLPRTLAIYAVGAVDEGGSDSSACQIRWVSLP